MARVFRFLLNHVLVFAVLPFVGGVVFGLFGLPLVGFVGGILAGLWMVHSGRLGTA